MNRAGEELWEGIKNPFCLCIINYIINFMLRIIAVSKERFIV